MFLPPPRPLRIPTAAAVGAALVLLVSGCGGNTPAGSAPSSTAAPSSSTGAAVSAPATDGALSIADTWVKATGGADPSMTAAFGVLTNAGDTPLTITSASTSASGTTELHEMAMDNGAMVMRPVAGGIVIPAHGTTALAPGGLHVMLLDVTTPIQPGDQVSVTLNVDNGSSLTFTALAKDFAGAQESYSPSSDLSSMSMSGMPTMSQMPSAPTSAAAGG